MKISAKGFMVHLDEIALDDADAISEGVNDPEVILSVPSIPSPYSRYDAMRFIEFATKVLAESEEFHLGVRLDGGLLVGMCALGNIDRKNGRGELGYWIDRRHRGRGYAKEAVRLMLGFGFTRLGLNRIYARVLDGNRASAELLRSVGFSMEGISREDTLSGGKYSDSRILSMLKKEYKDEMVLDVA